MSLPVATYRLQFRNGFGFQEAAKVAPHLANAGISHVYASPLFRAAEGSSHGYDVADHEEIEPALGGREGFLAFSEALKAAGLKLILDIVPNHMAASPDNPWWRDVLAHGDASRFGGHFDIDWSAGKLVLPILGRPFGEALDAGDVRRATHPEWGEVLSVPGHDLPMAPGTEAIADVAACHEAQHYRIAHWRLGRDGLTYRRFFEITGLVGVRVENPAVFDDVHRLTKALIDEGHVHGLRVDHVDGLADPAGYLDRLQSLGVPVYVEKILEAGEALPPWPVEGTTGYEFVAGLAAALTHPDGLARLSAAYGAIAEDDVHALEAAAKHEIATVNLAGEFARLTNEASALFAADLSTRDHGPDTVRRGLVALSTATGVYRSYIAGLPGETDRAIVEAARERADDPALDERRVIDDLADLILSGREDAQPFVARWQQTTGPLMAKAVEDTLFYRHHRAIARNEVGGHPAAPLGAPHLDTAMALPGLAATQTHDTKRGEDARARLHQLSHPDAAAWWEPLWQALPGDMPARWRWAMGQMWLGGLPLKPDPDFAARYVAAVEKSAREAKEETRWTRMDEAFEARLREAAEAIAHLPAPEGSERLMRAGVLASLSQVALKTFAAAAPDIYQGTFGWDFSFVDPDNRRPVDFAAEAQLCAAARRADAAELIAHWRDPRIKARVILEGLALRQQVAADGPPQRLTANDAPVLAYWRGDGNGGALVAVPRYPFGALARVGAALDPARLGPVAVDLPHPVHLRVTGEWIGPGLTDLSPALQAFPVLQGASR